MGNKFIRNYIAKRVAGRSDDGIMITLSDPKKIDFQVAMMEDLLMRNGIDPRAITSENQFKGILNLLKSLEKGQTQSSGITGTKSAEIFNIEGRSLDPNKPIIGGTQTGKELSPELSERLRGTNVDRIKQKIADRKIESDEPPPGSRGGDEDIAAPVQSQEETMKNMMEAEIKANIEAQNKKGIENILKRKNREDVYGLEDYDTTNMSEIKKEIIRTETKLGNLNPDDPNFRAKAKPLIDKIEALKNKMRDDKADGGIMRLGFKDGMNRRTFLKILGGAVSIPIIGKFFKPMKVGKTVKKLPVIQTDDVAGKPEWFDQLVNKVILEGDEVTKNFATKDREIVHMKKLDKDNNVIVYQDLDEGAVRVEYQSKDNMFGEQVDLRYRKPNPDEGDPRPSAEFDVEESGIVGRADGPDDYSMEVEGVGGSSISDLESDLTKLKTYATGQKPTIKELADSMKRKKNVRYYETPEGQTDYVTTRQGDEVPDYDDYAAGGIARMLGE